MKTRAFALLLALLLLALPACGGTQTASASTPAPAPTPVLRFSTTDRDGQPVDESILAGHKVVLLNFWEPWYPPCVAGMPDLEKLYEKYREQGLLVIGVYTSTDQEAQVEQILRDSGTSYPILRYSPDFESFQTGYVPTTVFLDGSGQALSELLVGSRSYEGWEELILVALK